MAENKKSFLLYCDIIHTIKQLPKDKIGELFIHILEYVNDMNPETDDLLVKLTFEPIKQSFKRDLKKWEKRAERSRDNGKLGGRPPKKENPENPVGYLETQTNPDEPRKPDSDSDSDSVSVSVSVSDIYYMKDCKNPSNNKIITFSIKCYNAFLNAYPDNKDIPLLTVKEFVPSIRNLIEEREYSEDQIMALIDFSYSDNWWHGKIYTSESLLNNFEKLKVAYKKQKV